MSHRQAQYARFLFLCIFSVIAFWPAIAQVTRLALEDDRYGHIILIPVISFILIYMRREEIFSNVQSFLTVGALLIAFGGVFYRGGRFTASWLSQDGKLLISIFAFVIVCIAAFTLTYGREAFRRARFALLFLFFMLPVPAWIMDKAVVALQHGSAEISYVFLQLLGVPVFAQGVRFSLPGIDIEVARECSGIRSCVSLVITSVLAGYVFLRSGYSRISLVLLTIPIALLKNAARITIITWLGLYVSRDFFFGALHKRGGLAFAVLALMMMLPLVYIFRGWESRIGRRPATATNV